MPVCEEREQKKKKRQCKTPASWSLSSYAQHASRSTVPLPSNHTKLFDSMSTPCLVSVCWPALLLLAIPSSSPASPVIGPCARCTYADTLNSFPQAFVHVVFLSIGRCRVNHAQNHVQLDAGSTAKSCQAQPCMLLSVIFFQSFPWPQKCF
jgi:hypothetical protein